MTGAPQWTVWTSPEVDELVLGWARAGGETAKYAAHFSHALQQLEILGTKADDAHPVGGVPGLWQLRQADLRIFFDTAPNRTIVIGAVVAKLRGGSLNQGRYGLYGRKVAEFKAVVMKGET